MRRAPDRARACEVIARAACATSRSARPGRDLRGAVVRAAGALPDRPARSRGDSDAAEPTAASPIVTVNLWFDRAGDEPTASSGCPAATMQWVFDKRRSSATRSSHLSLVSSGADGAGRRRPTRSSSSWRSAS